MNFQLKIRSGPRGSALFGTIIITAILGLALAAYLTLVTNQNQMVFRSQAWNSALPVAEAGVEEALTHCYNNSDNLAAHGWRLSGGVYVKTNSLSDGGLSGPGLRLGYHWDESGYYGVSITPTQPYVIKSTGYYPMPSGEVFASRTIQVTATNPGVFFAAIVVKDTIDMNGNDVLTDSYDSTDPAKSTLGKYDPLKAGDKGDIVTTTGLTNSLKIGNANVWGRAITGPTGGVYTGPNGAVGSTNWQRSGKSGVESGWWINDLNYSIPDVTAPFVAAAPPASGLVGAVLYPVVLANGNYMMSKLTANTVVTGKAVLYVTSSIQFGNGETITILPGASLKIYYSGTDASFNPIVNNNGPAAFQYFGLNSNNGTIAFSGQNGITGCIDAPYAKIVLTGGGHIDGSIVARTVKMNGNAALHYDESLKNIPPKRLIITSWNEI